MAMKLGLSAAKELRESTRAAAPAAVAWRKVRRFMGGRIIGGGGGCPVGGKLGSSVSLISTDAIQIYLAHPSLFAHRREKPRMSPRECFGSRRLLQHSQAPFWVDPAQS